MVAAAVLMGCKVNVGSTVRVHCEIGGYMSGGRQALEGASLLNIRCLPVDARMKRSKSKMESRGSTCTTRCFRGEHVFSVCLNRMGSLQMQDASQSLGTVSIHEGRLLHWSSVGGLEKPDECVFEQGESRRPRGWVLWIWKRGPICNLRLRVYQRVSGEREADTGSDLLDASPWH